MSVKANGTVLLDRFEVAEMFGIAPRTVAWRVQHGHFIPPVRLGNRPFWRERDIQRFLESLPADA